MVFVMARPLKHGEETRQITVRLPVSVLALIDMIGGSKADAIVAALEAYRPAVGQRRLGVTTDTRDVADYPAAVVGACDHVYERGASGLLRCKICGEVQR